MKISSKPRKMPRIIAHEIDQGTVLETDELKITGFMFDHPPTEQPFGFKFDSQNRRVVISGDTVPFENLIKHTHGVDVLLHNCVDKSKIRCSSFLSAFSANQ